MKKVISMVLTLALLFALAVPAFATDGQALTQAENTEPNIDTTGSVKYQHGNTTYITHNEII